MLDVLNTLVTHIAIAKLTMAVNSNEEEISLFYLKFNLSFIHDNQQTQRRNKLNVVSVVSVASVVSATYRPSDGIECYFLPIPVCQFVYS